MQIILTVVHLFLALGIIGLVLMQHGKGADAGAAFGSGASGTVFGAQGASNFLSRTTAILAALFFVTSIALGYFSMNQGGGRDIMAGVGTEETPVAPQAEEKAAEADMPPVTMDNNEAVDDMPPVASEPAEEAAQTESKVPENTSSEQTREEPEASASEPTEVSGKKTEAVTVPDLPEVPTAPQAE
jgi:preprotein translocase subunit SecG